MVLEKRLLALGPAGRRAHDPRPAAGRNRMAGGGWQGDKPPGTADEREWNRPLQSARRAFGRRGIDRSYQADKAETATALRTFAQAARQERGEKTGKPDGQETVRVYQRPLRC